MPIRFQSNPINPRLPTSHHSGTNPSTIHYQYPNSMSICQSWTNPSIPEQSWTNLMTIICTNCRSHANLIVPDQSINQLPIRQFNANPPLIHLSWNNPMPICQSQSDANLTTGTNPTQNRSTSQIPITIQKSITNPQIHYKPGNPLTINQSWLNPPSHERTL